MKAEMDPQVVGNGLMRFLGWRTGFVQSSASIFAATGPFSGVQPDPTNQPCCFQPLGLSSEHTTARTRFKP